jgi:hypothetical protein
MGSTREKVVTKRVNLKLPATTSRKRLFSNDRDAPMVMAKKV